jgi:hypothetical protein
MTDIRTIARDIKSFASGLDKHLVSGLRRFEWKPEDGLLDLIVRAAVTRQHDGLMALADLVVNERGDVAAILLRPACEEFIVLKYLVSVDRSDADLLLKCLAKRDILAALEAQNDYSGPDVMKDLRLDGLLANSRRGRRPWLELQGELMAKLGWKKPGFPSVYFMAKRAGEERRYKFLYHATSRAVHFNVGELLRRVWGQPGKKMTIGYNAFERYWANFAVSWGFQLYVDTVLLSLEADAHADHELPDQFSDEIVGLIERISKVGQVPIITAEELAWPFPDSGDSSQVLN